MANTRYGDIINALADGPVDCRELSRRTACIHPSLLSTETLESDGTIIRSSITPTDAIAVDDAISKLALVMPGLADSRDVQQMALMALGINNTADVLDAMNEEMPESKRGDILKAVRDLREAIAGGL